MTNTNTITIPTDPPYPPEPHGRQRPVRTAAKAVAGVAVAFALGWGAASATIDTEAPAVVPAATVVVPARPAMSPDAMTRWAENSEARSAPVSPDAAERHALTEAERQPLTDDTVAG